MEDNQNKRGFQLLKQGEAALNRFGWFGMLNAAKYDDAIQYFSKAANIFKMTQNYQLAGETFLKVAGLEIKANSNNYEASNYYINAAHMFKHVEAEKSLKCFTQGIQLLIDEGRFGIAAKHSETMGDIYEKSDDIKNAIKYYRQAANFFVSDNSPSRGNKNFEKIAFLSGKLQDYKTAAEYFDKLGRSCLESNLLKFNAKKHFFHALLCVLARNDLVAVANSLETYKSIDYTFGDSRECKLINDLKTDVEGFDIDNFSDHLFAYDQISKLTPWQTEIMLIVKKKIEETGEEEPDLC